MFITITGELGSGKTTVAKILNQEYGFDFYSTGSIQREIAKEKGITTLELNQLMSNDVNNIYDKMIDDKTVEISRENRGRNVVFDSRMAWHFVEESFKVYVTVDSYMAAQRVIKAGRGVEEQYASLEEAAKSLRKRKQLEDSRFAEIYSVRTTDFSNYDLIVDSTFISPEELAKLILEKAGNGAGRREIYLSPQRLLPTKAVREMKKDSAADFGEQRKDEPVEVVEFQHFYYLVKGHYRVCTELTAGEKLIPVRLLAVDSEGNVIGEKGDKYCVKAQELAAVSLEYCHDWEVLNSMQFLGYPSATDNL